MRKGAKTAAVFDISSGSVGGSLVSISSKQVPLILYTTRVPITFQEERTEEGLLFAMLSSLRVSAERLHKHLLHTKDHLKQINVVFASPWHLSRTHLIKAREEKPFVVTERYLRDMMRAAKQHSLKGAHATVSDKQLVRLEETIIQTYLNGYPTSDPYGKRAAKLDAVVYLSFIDHSVRSCVLKELEKFFGNVDIDLHSFLLTAFFAAREVHDSLTDALLIDVSGEVTDISVVRDGTLADSISFPWGYNYVLRELASKLGTIPEEARTMLRLVENTTSEETQIKIEQAKAEIREIWLEALGKACTEIAEDGRLPNSVLLTTLPDLAPWFSEVLREKGSSHYTYTREPFSVELLGGQKIAKRVQYADGAPHDPFLAVETVALADKIAS